MNYSLSVDLYRDGVCSPWGFRLKGGIDVDGGTPLEIIKVFVGSASDGQLVPGDKVVSINHQDTSKLTHLEAQNLIKNSGTSAQVEVIRHGYNPQSGYLGGGQEIYDYLQDNDVAKVQNQPFRTTPLVSPTPRTINELHQKPTSFSPTPMTSPSPYGGHHQPMSKTIQIGGSQKQIVSQQFNSPMNMYSDEAIAESAVANQALLQSNVPTLGQIQNNAYHPGFVPSSTKPHLPTPRDSTFSRPQASETFKIIMESEMDKAKDHQGMVGSEFPKEKHSSRPSSVMSNNSSTKRDDPFMINNNINQSTSFKRLMYSLGEAEY